eukprot:CAMPEP_0170841596 /NCGR_PEP_ID=MMETSP0734-20130129/5268_1 /TAXON_ID=186038 /ORGANISM="Fragilariopsis kerguelensis, Strain L26-C5" /LENGTH=38 /DNA_ID= /DNA_START= /DNA_END= /DNA_ORIENTATION=
MADGPIMDTDSISLCPHDLGRRTICDVGLYLSVIVDTL